jgi:3-dehydroquinate synthase
MIPEYVDITEAAKDSLEDLLLGDKYTQIAVLCDEHTLEHCYPLLKDVLRGHHVIEVPSGEDQKNLDTCHTIWNQITYKEFDRKSLLINLGGGVIGDMGGFCASTYKRGIDFVQVPTTLLAQVDASIGGKLGIDFNGYKNHIGVFNLPVRVVVDPVFLDTLPDRQIKSGYAEVIKHGLIHNKTAFNSLLNFDLSNTKWLETIKESIKIKGEIVESDPFEKAQRKLLNFGHTIGHAIETQFLEKHTTELLHGEAVAIGMICESWLSNRKLNLPTSQLEKIQKYLTGIYGKIDLDDLNIDEFVGNLKQDKKNKGNKILFSLLNEIGEARFDVSISPEEAIESLEYYRNM